MLLVAPALRRDVHRRCLVAAPREACGLLLGSRDGQRRRVARAVELANVADSRPTDRFRVSATDFAVAAGAARDEGLDVVGTWHSHPSGCARASMLDRRAAQAGWSHWIVGVRDGRVVEERVHAFDAAGVLAEESLGVDAEEPLGVDAEESLGVDAGESLGVDAEESLDVDVGEGLGR